MDELMTTYRATGSSAAFARLHRRLHPHVRRQIAARVVDRADVEDLTQLTFLRLHLAKERYAAPPGAGDGAVIAWACTIARNTAISHIRRCRADRLRFDCAAQRRVEQATFSYTHSDEIVARDKVDARRSHAVREAVAELPEGQRAVVERSKFKGVPMKTIARELGLRDVAVRVRAHRAYRVLRNRLQHLRAAGLQTH